MAKAKIKAEPIDSSEAVKNASKQINLSMEIASETINENKVDETISETPGTKPTMEKLVVKLKDGKKDEWRKFFGGYGKNLSDGVRMCVDYVFQGVKDGTLKISDCGIRENKINDLLNGRYD